MAERMIVASQSVTQWLQWLPIVRQVANKTPKAICRKGADARSPMRGRIFRLEFELEARVRARCL